MPYSVRVRVRFSSAHYLENYQGKCEKVHGHNYVVEVWVQSQRVNKNGLTYDFTKLKNDIKKLLPDHQLLNEVFAFNPTAENLAKHFYKELKKWYPVKKVAVWETEDSAAEYEP